MNLSDLATTPKSSKKKLPQANDRQLLTLALSALSAIANEEEEEEEEEMSEAGNAEEVD